MSELRTKSDTAPELVDTAADDLGRERMLRELLVTLDTHQRVKRVRRAVRTFSAGAVAVAAVVIGARWGLNSSARSSVPVPAVVKHSPGDPAAPDQRPAFRCEIVSTRDVAREVTVLAHATTMVQFIDDEQLLAALNQERACYGLVRMGGRAAVLDRCVR